MYINLLLRLNVVWLLSLLRLSLTSSAWAQTINTFAGKESENVPATSSHLGDPTGLARDGAGNIYFSEQDNNRIRKMTPAGIITTVAGTGSSGYSGDGGQATSAQLNTPLGVAVDGGGNLYIADPFNSRIRKVNTSGVITTVAGTGSPGYSGDGDLATSAKLNTPYGIAIDGSGNLYIADSGNNRIRKVNATTGIISTTVGTGTAGNGGLSGVPTAAQLNYPTGVALDSFGNIYIADLSNNRVLKVQATVNTIILFNGTGTSGSGPTQLTHPFGLTSDAVGNVYIADTGNHRIKKVDTGFNTSIVAGAGVNGYNGDGIAATSALLFNPSGVVLDGSNNLYITDTGNERVRKVLASTGTISTIAGTGIQGSSGYGGDGGAATSALVTNPFGVTMDGSGNLYIADTGNHCIRKVNTSGVITTVAGKGSPGHSGDTGLATAAQLNSPSGVAVDGSGNIYIADELNSRIRKVSAATGIITTVAGTGSPGYSGNGGLATSAKLNTPYGIAIDGSGNLYIADTENHCIRKVNTSGIISTVVGNGNYGYSGDGRVATAAQLYLPYGVAIDGSGNLYIADSYNYRIRKVNTMGIITTVAGNGTSGYGGDGGAATSAQLRGPSSVTVDGSSNLYIADRFDNRIRKVNQLGVISTVAGSVTVGFSGDGSLATAAQLNNSTGVAVDGSSNLYIADSNNNRIRVVNCVSMYSVKAGSWSDVSVWSCGRLPVVTDELTLNHAVNLSSSYVGKALRLIYGSAGGLLLNGSSRLNLSVN